MKKYLIIMVATLSAIMTMLSTTSVSAGTFKYGDINKDGEVSIMDVTLLQKHLVELTTLDETALKAADVNGDGAVDITDVTMIQKYIAEYITKFPADKGQPTTDSDGYNSVIVKP